MSPDVVVIGLGVMGTATAMVLAQRGQRVVGIERFDIGHDHGSSHGDTRIIRLGYFEHPSYVPLLHSAYRLWRELENETGQQLLHVTGIAEIGQPDSEIVKGTLRASQEHGLPHRVLDARQAMQCFPAFRLPSDYVAVVQPDGGYLFAERAVLGWRNDQNRQGLDRCRRSRGHAGRMVQFTDGSIPSSVSPAAESAAPSYGVV